MSTNDGADGESSLRRRTSPVPSTTRLRVRPDPFLICCRCFSVLTALTAILCIVVNVFSAIQSFTDGSDVFDGIFRCYAVVIGIIVVVAETEWGFVMKFWKILEYWAGRGMLQIFVAVMTRAFPNESSTKKGLVLLQNIASYMLLACGGIYFISDSAWLLLLAEANVCSFRNTINSLRDWGILCIGFVKRARQKTEISREQAVKDLEDLERRREELEQLLIEERD